MRGGQTAERLLYQLKSRGPQSAATLAAACAITPMGAHKQLQSLQEQGLVEADDEIQGPGRPRRIWRLTESGHGRFPDRHGELAVQLIRQAAAVLGEQALDQLIAARERDMAVAYGERLRSARSLQAKVQRLAELRAEEGYLARIEKAEGRAWLLIEDHCPICAAASQCQGFCRSELQLFRELLGPQVSVERTEHLLADARRCAYRIAPA
ncbi:helix-turn-helix transcriptional regulator [Pelomonas sp. SE-A7]|uniref:helix-turn-helix transcriptional regulator n=1 Tax=Pelomonas sp. SE-A7 TaxID=3054953 RepID=UPI00259CD599|nr:helix-turn-helix transcriptional regulator [Pelomonas sp. SE-A7]MDM4764704.1 helix-turn-helix transcriptional regulator [Pelomonas sp. SE-A7]